MITLRLSIQEAKVLETVMAEAGVMPALETVHLVEAMKKLGAAMDEYSYEKNQANHDF